LMCGGGAFDDFRKWWCCRRWINVHGENLAGSVGHALHEGFEHAGAVGDLIGRLIGLADDGEGREGVTWLKAFWHSALQRRCL